MPSNLAEAGHVVSLWRYPVKSMLGEELPAAEITEDGLLGDRAYAIIDNADGKAASAKNPRKWPNLFDFRAKYVEPVLDAAHIPLVRITLPDGASVTSDKEDLNQILSKALNRDVTLRAAQLGPIKAEAYWLDMGELAHRDEVTEFSLREGTFFDGATIHLLTTTTLDHLSELYPQGRFDARRFRPNIVVQLSPRGKGFAEDAWIGHTLAIGSTLRLEVTRPCGRCVMTTLPQGDLPQDPGILRTVAQHHDAKVGVYCVVKREGRIQQGDVVRIE